MLNEGAIEPDGKSNLEIWKDEEIFREKHHLTHYYYYYLLARPSWWEQSKIESTKLSGNIIKIKTITVTVITIKYELS